MLITLAASFSNLGCGALERTPVTFPFLSILKMTFKDYNNLLSWDRHRFKRLLDNDWIEIFRPKTKRLKTMYSVTYKTQRMVDMVYKKLSGEEIPMSQTSNPMFAKNVSYNDQVYRNMIIEMNKTIRQQRRLSPE